MTATDVGVRPFTPARGGFGAFGGMYVPELLVPALEELDG